MFSGNLLITLLIYILGQAAFVAAIVQFLKKNDWIAANARTVAAALNIALMFLSTATFLPPELNQAVIQFLTAVITAFGSVGAYEYIKRRGEPGVKQIL